jgi:hypothetical protein
VQKWLDEVGQYPIALTAIGGLGAAVCGAGLRASWGNWTMGLWMLGIAVAVVLPTLSTRVNRLQQGRRAAKKCVKNALEACAVAYGHPGRHVRSNIMLLLGNGRRRVDAETAFNMRSDADSDLEIDATAGVSGEAFFHRATIYGDLQLALQEAGPSWGLRDAESAKIRPTLKSILSVPLFDPDHPERQLLGTLQVDSDLRFDQMEFDKPERRAVAERFGDVIALLLKAGR